MCCHRNGGFTPNETVALSSTTHSVTATSTEPALCRAYSSAPVSPITTSATTMTAARMIASGLRHRDDGLAGSGGGGRLGSTGGSLGGGGPPGRGATGGRFCAIFSV